MALYTSLAEGVPPRQSPELGDCFATTRAERGAVFHNKLRQYLLEELRLGPGLLDRHFDSTAEENGKVIFVRHKILAFVHRHLLNIGKSLFQVIYTGVTQVENHFAAAVSWAPQIVVSVSADDRWQIVLETVELQ